MVCLHGLFLFAAMAVTAPWGTTGSSAHPRPQLERALWATLDGPWEYAIRSVDIDIPPSGSWDGEIRVPYPIESPASGVQRRLDPKERLWMKRTFTLSSAWRRGSRIRLHFGAVDWEASVFVNGRHVGSHQGGYTPFSIDISDALGPHPWEEEHQVVVRIWDPTREGGQPVGKQSANPNTIFYTPVSGIWQTVWLEPVPENSIESVKIVPDLANARVAITVQARTDNEVEIAVLAEGEKIAQGKGRATELIYIPLRHPREWSPEDPFLYDLDISMGEDEVRSYFGMREISIGKDEKGFHRFLLNGREIFLHGVLDQGYWPEGLYAAPSDAALRADIEAAKSLGFNTVRKHMKVEPARWYYWADRLGMLVWQDQPCLLKTGEDWTIYGDKADLDIPERSRLIFRQELKEMLDALQTHPSIIVWVPFNEGWGQHDTNEIIEWIADYDPTRLVDGPSGWVDRGAGHIRDEHKYRGLKMPEILPNRVSVLGEFGGFGVAVKGHVHYPDWTFDHGPMSCREALLSTYADTAAQLVPYIEQGMAGAIYTQLTDVEQETNGLLTYDRKVEKVPASILAAINRQVISGTFHIEKEAALPTSYEKPQEWRYTFATPANTWPRIDFDDSSWENGRGGFGTLRSTETTVSTFWPKGEIWLRRDFELDTSQLSSPQFLVYHTGPAEVYVNGVKALELTGSTKSYMPMTFSPEAAASLRAGRNVIAIHCRSIEETPYVDIGIENWKVSKEPPLPPIESR